MNEEYVKEEEFSLEPPLDYFEAVCLDDPDAVMEAPKHVHADRVSIPTTVPNEHVQSTIPWEIDGMRQEMDFVLTVPENEGEHRAQQLSPMSRMTLKTLHALRGKDPRWKVYGGDQVLHPEDSLHADNTSSDILKMKIRMAKAETGLIIVDAA